MASCWYSLYPGGLLPGCGRVDAQGKRTRCPSRPAAGYKTVNVFSEGSMKHRLSWPWYVALLLAIALSGCGKSDPLGRQAVSGVVTLDGQPLEQGAITFLPQEKKATSGGAVITNGKYAVPREQGLAPGKYKITITASKGGAVSSGEAPGMPVAAVELIPAEYNTKSDKTVDVTAQGPNAFNFDIVTKR